MRKAIPGEMSGIMSIPPHQSKSDMHTPSKCGEYCNSLVWAVLEELFPSRFKRRTHGFQLVIIRTPLYFCIAATEMLVSKLPAWIVCTNFCALKDLPPLFHCARFSAFV
jgi:hypothetical protein